MCVGPLVGETLLMCGIFGVVVDSSTVDQGLLKDLAEQARRRGRDSSGLVVGAGGSYRIQRADHDVMRLLRASDTRRAHAVLGHSRLITDGMADNQPVVVGEWAVLHNGIVTNADQIWHDLDIERRLDIDSEVIPAILEQEICGGATAEEAAQAVLARCRGVVSCAAISPTRGELLLFSNNGSLYVGQRGAVTAFSSEEHVLRSAQFGDIQNVRDSVILLTIPTGQLVEATNTEIVRRNLVPAFSSDESERALLRYEDPGHRRCSKCILPETMPFIRFDANGVCNYCANYRVRNVPRDLDELEALIQPYRRTDGLECIIPFSGGRDSSFALHVAARELGLRCVTYTYDWGMVTDLGRRNVSRMCQQLSVENIIIAADISKKRRNIALNLKAWLNHPNLGLLSLLTAGDKYFFKYLSEVQEKTGVSLNIWGINPLETTHFKAGFLGIAPSFESKTVYRGGLGAQVDYHAKRFREMARGKGYFNRSLPDTLAGEYWRSVHKKHDYFHLFDFWRWDEDEINNLILGEYDWEMAPDTSTTWRIGDGTAAFYNYANYTIAGFTEHDTFRSNQIREGQLSRERALELVTDENQPRYENIRWYLDTIGFDFSTTVRIVNSMRRSDPWDLVESA